MAARESSLDAWKRKRAASSLCANATTMTMAKLMRSGTRVEHYSSKDKSSILLISTLRIDWLLLLCAKMSTCRVTSKRGAFSRVFSPLLDGADFDGTFLHHLHFRLEPFSSTSNLRVCWTMLSVEGVVFEQLFHVVKVKSRSCRLIDDLWFCTRDWHHGHGEPKTRRRRQQRANAQEAWRHGC